MSPSIIFEYAILPEVNFLNSGSRLSYRESDLYSCDTMPRPVLTKVQAQERLDAKWPGKFRLIAYKGAARSKIECRTCCKWFSRRFHDQLRRGSCTHCRKHAEKKRHQKLAGNGCQVMGGVDYDKNRNGWLSCECPKHGPFRVRVGKRLRCRRCHPPSAYMSSANLPKSKRNKPCDLYLVHVRDSVGYWTKVGISTDWKSRHRNYKHEGVTVLREVRMYRTTLYRALQIEEKIKKWSRRELGKRSCPRRKWAGWSESFKDPDSKLPGVFDRAIVLDKARRSA